MSETTAITVEKEIAKCSKCGKCRSVCPVFIETRSEGMVARGRISLAEALLSGEMRDTAKMRRYLWGCLKCLRCVDACPSGVRFDKIISEARRRVGSRVGMPWFARTAMRLMLPRRWLFDIAVKSAALWEKILPLHREGRIRHLPMLFGDHRSMPELAKKSVLKSFADYYGDENAKRKVALFVGCLGNYAYPEVVTAEIAVLNATGAGVYVPKGQVCCGAAASSLGDEKLLARLERLNEEAFAGLGIEAIIVGCASGGATLKGEYPAITGRENPLGAPVEDFSEYVAKHSEKIKGRFGGQVSWHDPCHLKFVQKVTAPPRELLGKVADYREIEGADYCCGMGGVFSAFFPDISAQIGTRKTDAIRAGGAEVMATGCSGCILQLRDRLAAAGADVKVMHVAEVLAEALEEDSGKDKPGGEESIA